MLPRGARRSRVAPEAHSEARDNPPYRTVNQGSLPLCGEVDGRDGRPEPALVLGGVHVLGDRSAVSASSQRQGEALPVEARPPSLAVDLESARRDERAPVVDHLVGEMTFRPVE